MGQELATLRDLRIADYNQASIDEIKDACFLSVYGTQHQLCKRFFEEIAQGRSMEEVPELWRTFYCLGPAAICGKCGALVPPGSPTCLKCKTPIHNPPSTQEEWLKRVLARAIADNIKLLSAQANHAGHIILHAARLVSQRNLLNWSASTSQVQKELDLKNYLFDALEQGRSVPASTDWLHNWARYVAKFIVHVWPQLEAHQVNIEDLDKYSSNQILYLVRRYNTDGPKAIEDFLKDPENFRRRTSGKQAAVIEHQLLRSAKVLQTQEGAYLLVPLSPEELEQLLTKYQWEAVDVPSIYPLLNSGL